MFIIAVKLLLSTEASPFIPHTMFMPAEMFKAFLVVLLTDKNSLTEGRVLHKSAYKENPLTVMHFVLFRGHYPVLLSN